MYIGVSDVRQIEIHTAEPLVPDPSPFDVEMAIAEFIRYKSLCSDQIPTEMIQVGGEPSEIHWNKEKLSDQWGGVYYCTSSQEG
jgi:hypothetical protein